MAKYKRVLVEVKRGPMSSTSVAIRPWELPILEEIHGNGQVVPVMGEESVQHAEVLGLLKEEEFDCDNDLELEYDRLQTFYGMHVEVKVPNVERCYGKFSEGRFAKAVRQACAASNRKISGAEFAPTRTPKQVSLDDLRDHADDLGVDWTPEMTAEEIQAAIDKLVAQAA